MTSLTHDDYTVACICPMGVEQAPVEAMLDEIHPMLPTSRDKNSYTLGRMGIHNVAVACMPGTGNNIAASVANQLLNDFRCIRFSLLIGIGGGVPNLERGVDIRLGDVVVSKPSGGFGGVVQFDMGKVLANGQFERTGTLQKPPGELLDAVERLELDSEIPSYLRDMVERYPKMKRGNYTYQGSENDRLFRAGFVHPGGQDCQGCDPVEIVERECRPDSSPVVHYGTIGSSNAVIKDAALRDMLRDDLNIQCVEMEAAGLMTSFPCLVIRGICDYADSHKNKRWQPYAAATAAAYAKELLSLVPASNRASPAKAQSNPSTSQAYVMIQTGNVGNLVNGSVSGDIVAGDKFNGDRVVRKRWYYAKS
jgi:nucleoside phosphorylase